MDELIENGPIVAQLDLYQDLIEWNKNLEKCVNEIYKHNTQEEHIGKYYVTIVGYGYSYNKYYWLVQNSIGVESCKISKIEFGQIGIERIAFSVPYIENSISKKDINISFVDIDDACQLLISNNSLIDEWENSLEIVFKNNKSNNRFYYQCNHNQILNKTEINCFYPNSKYFSRTGFYIFNNWQSLGKNNIFNLDETFKSKFFYFYGYDTLDFFSTNKIYISDKGSMIILNYIPQEKSETDIPLIYPNINSSKYLTNCNEVKSNKDLITNFIYCKLGEDEIEYFGDFNKDNIISYSVLCGKKSKLD